MIYRNLLVLIIAYFFFVTCSDSTSFSLSTTAQTFVSDSVLKSFDVRCILSDVDGTLLPHNKLFSDITFNSISDIIRRGYPFFPCTGRTRSSMVSALGNDFIKLYGEKVTDIPGVYQQGLLVYGTNGELIYERNLEDDVIQRIIDFCHKHNASLLACAGDVIYCKERNENTIRITTYSDPIPIEVPEGLHTLKSKGISIQKMIIVEDDLVLHTVRPILEIDLFNMVSITKAVSGLLEVLPFGKLDYNFIFQDLSMFLLGASKGIGVEQLLKHFGVSSEHTMAFGDGENDIEMIKYVKYGVCMENANSKLKSVSKYITNTDNDHGVARILQLLPEKEI